MTTPATGGQVVAFGELMMRLSPPGDERLFQSPTLRTWFGGSEANVLAGLAALGTDTAFVSRVPAHAVGDAAVAALRAHGVGTRHVARGGARLGLYFVEPGADIRALQVVYDRAGSAFAGIGSDDVHWPTVLDGASWLHLSGITPALGDGPARLARDAAHAARAAGVRVSLDLNWRAALWAGRDPRPLVAPLADACDLLVGNPHAFATMLGLAVPHDAPGSAAHLAALARHVAAVHQVAHVALTHREVRSASEHGWRTALLDAARDTLHVSRPWTVRVVDRVGGGDAFVAALLHALLAGRPGGDALAFATAASALKLTIPGDFNRVSADEVERARAAHDAAAGPTDDAAPDAVAALGAADALTTRPSTAPRPPVPA